MALVACGLAAAGCGASAPGAPLRVPGAAALPRSKISHVVVVVMENKEDTDVIGNPDAPYTNRLIHRYGLAARSYGVRHPSLPNYLALTSGSTHGITTDCTGCQISAPNIVEQLARARISWRGYFEDQPGRCFSGASAQGYAKKHNPFIYYDDVAGNPKRCRNLVGFGRLSRDLRRGTLPTFVWVTPNLCDDTHDCGVATGDRFLARTAPRLIHELGPHGFLVVTYDEGDSDAGCCEGAAADGRIATIVAGPDVRRGARMRRPIDHYGVLGSIERALGLHRLGAAADHSNGSLRRLFHHAPRIR